MQTGRKSIKSWLCSGTKRKPLCFLHSTHVSADSEELRPPTPPARTSPDSVPRPPPPPPPPFTSGSRQVPNRRRTSPSSLDEMEAIEHRIRMRIYRVKLAILRIKKNPKSKNIIAHKKKSVVMQHDGDWFLDYSIFFYFIVMYYMISFKLNKELCLNNITSFFNL